MKCVLICHEEEILNRIALAHWLSSFTDLQGIVVLKEDPSFSRMRIQREIRRLGLFRFLDVLAFRIYSRIFWRAKERRTEQEILNTILQIYPAPTLDPESIIVADTNSEIVKEFLTKLKPDLILARCKQLLRKEIFSIPKHGTFVLHPGICPEYRNAHGCFWALVRRDLKNVGATLLKVDEGVDTGPIYGYFRYPFEEKKESHIEIQHWSVFANLEAIKNKLEEIFLGKAQAISVLGRGSKNWGQAWLSKYFAWKLQAHRCQMDGNSVTTLLFHDVSDEPEKTGFPGKEATRYTLNLQNFEKILTMLKKKSVFVSLPDEEFRLPDQSLLLAFDDGGVSSHSIIAPRLENLGWRGLFFVATKFIGEPGFMNQEQILDLFRRGHHIASHSHSHPMRFSSLSESELKFEWETSKTILTNLLSYPVQIASVPGGYYSERVAKSAASAGYRILFHSEPIIRVTRIQGMKVLGRFSINQHSTIEEVEALAMGQSFARTRQYISWNTKKLLKKIGGKYWLWFRSFLLNR